MMAVASDDAVAAAMRSAYYLLRYRDRSEQEMRERLRRKGYVSAVIDTAVMRLRDAGLLDDVRLAANLVRIASEQKCLGGRGVRAYLQRRGISRDVIENCDVACDELDAAERLVARRLRSVQGLDPAVRRNRLTGALARRGFSVGTIRAVLASLEPGRKT
ncbi:MAG TPA: regulatory protein RecX [Dissulfurispiraceae bacterium]|nr:regulatory protein RecX [Dissulfurispiraceae bacterium]